MKEMFQVKISENKYYIFGENELTIIGNPKTNLLTCPRYYDLEILNGNSTIIKYTNNEPVIINSNEITDNGQFILEFSFGLPLTLEEHEILYKLYLKQNKENQTEEYQKENAIKNDIEKAKRLVKNRA